MLAFEKAPLPPPPDEPTAAAEDDATGRADCVPETLDTEAEAEAEAEEGVDDEKTFRYLTSKYAVEKASLPFSTYVVSTITREGPKSMRASRDDRPGIRRTAGLGRDRGGATVLAQAVSRAGPDLGERRSVREGTMISKVMR